MTWIKIALQVGILLLKYFFTLDKDKKARRKEALETVKKGFKSKTKDSIHRTIDRIRR